MFGRYPALLLVLHSLLDDIKYLSYTTYSEKLDNTLIKIQFKAFFSLVLKCSNAQEKAIENFSQISTFALDKILKLIFALTEGLGPLKECSEILTKCSEKLMEPPQKLAEGTYALVASTHALANSI